MNTSQARRETGSSVPFAVQFVQVSALLPPCHGAAGFTVPIDGLDWGEDGEADTAVQLVPPRRGVEHGDSLDDLSPEDFVS